MTFVHTGGVFWCFIVYCYFEAAERDCTADLALSLDLPYNDTIKGGRPHCCLFLCQLHHRGFAGNNSWAQLRTSCNLCGCLQQPPTTMTGSEMLPVQVLKLHMSLYPESVLTMFCVFCICWFAGTVTGICLRTTGASNDGQATPFVICFP